jgi:PAS domain-containing protein
VEASSVGLWDWNLVTNATMFSREYKRQLGYDDHEITSAQVEWATRVHPDDLAPRRRTCRRFSPATRRSTPRVPHAPPRRIVALVLRARRVAA